MKAPTKKISKTEIGGCQHLKGNQNTMEDDNIEAVIAKAKNQRRQKLFDQRVALLKAEDALKQLGGEDDYELSLSAIVTAYPNGISVSRVREFLPDSELLDAAKEALKEKGLIEVGTDKRSPLLKPKAASVKPGDGSPVEPSPTSPAPEKPTSKSAKTIEEETED